MGLMASGGKDFPKAPAGVHVARCYRILDLGWHLSNFKNEDGSDKYEHRVRIEWELPTKKMGDGRPFSVNNRYTLSLHKKANLRKHLESWRGQPFSKEDQRGFDISSLLGVPCQLQIIHDGDYANVENVMALPSGLECPAQENASFAYSIEDDPDGSIYDSLDEWMQKKINYRHPQNGATTPSDLPDDVPF